MAKIIRKAAVESKPVKAGKAGKVIVKRNDDAAENLDRKVKVLKATAKVAAKPEKAPAKVVKSAKAEKLAPLDLVTLRKNIKAGNYPALITADGSEKSATDYDAASKKVKAQVIGQRGRPRWIEVASLKQSGNKLREVAA